MGFIAWLGRSTPIGRFSIPNWFLTIFGAIILFAIVGALTGCRSDLTFATVKQVDDVEEKFDSAFEEMQDTVVLEKAKGTEDGTAAVAAIASGQEFTASVDKVDSSDPGIDWIALIGSILGINLAGITGLNAYRNRTRKKDIDASWEE